MTAPERRGPERPGPDYPPEWDTEPEQDHGCTCIDEPRRDCPWHGVEPT